MASLSELIRLLPKCELHCHIEGTLEPELLFSLAKRNHLSIPFSNVESLRAAYQFHNLQSFLDIFYAGACVLLHEQDFYDLTWAYLSRMAKENVKHVEIFFDPQTHTDRGVEFKTAITGIHHALEDAQKKFALSSKLILCFLRHLSAESAMGTLESALPYKSWIIAVGLDSGEKNNPPEKFVSVFERARKEGFLTVAHAGEEGPADYIWQAIHLLKVSRIDHGIHCTEDPTLMQYLASQRISLTVCPLSNVKLRVFRNLTEHNLKQLLEAGLCVSINSDDPAYFGGYLTENFLQTQKALSLSAQEICQLVRNSFEASFLPPKEKEKFFDEIESTIKELGFNI